MDQQTAQHRFHHIVVGVDGTPSSIAALRWAVAAASTSGAKVTALMGWLPHVAYGYPDLHLIRESEQHMLTDAVADLDCGHVQVEGVFAAGQPSGLLVEASKRADLVVLGARRHHGIVALAFGSISAHVLDHACCPVVIVPDTHVELVPELDLAAHVGQPA
jgi:nucleotide-binding universal stress UspA family protein